MSSPAEKDSIYKGAVRNELLYWIANEVDYKLLKQEADELGEMYDSEFERNIFDTMHGLVRIFQSKYSQKTGKLLKNKATVWRKLVNDNPDEIIKLFFGPNYDASSLMTIEDTWKAFISNDFPYKSKRKEIVKKTIEGLDRKGISYPDYFNDYVKGKLLLENVNEIKTTRTFMKKIHQMNVTEFIYFINILKNKLKNSKIDLSELNTTEKVDGSSFKLACYKKNIAAESSNSGLIYNENAFDQEQFKESLKYFKSDISYDIMAIAKKYKTWFKLIGEIFYVNDDSVIDTDSSVTFITTKYDSKKLGKIGSFIIFDCVGILNNKIVTLDDEVKNGIITDMLTLSNNDFKLFDINNFKVNDVMTIEIDYDTDIANEIFDNPEILAAKGNRQLFLEFKEALATAFSNQINKHKPILRYR